MRRSPRTVRSAHGCAAIPCSIRRLLLLPSTAAIVVIMVMLGAGSAGASPGSWLSRINGYRATNGRTRLVEDHQASQVAQRWTQQMAARNKLAHNPSYRTQVTTSWYRTGENVGRGASGARVFQAMVNATGHRANLLRPDFNRVGIGQVIVNGQLWTTHIFLATRA